MKINYNSGHGPTLHTLKNSDLEYNKPDKKLFTIDKSGNRLPVNGMVFRDSWMQKRYYENDIVLHGSGLYHAKIDTVNEPNTSTDWVKIADVTPTVGWSGTITAGQTITVVNGVITNVT